MERKKAKCRWQCPSCSYRVNIDDDVLLAQIETQLMRFVYQPDTIMAESISSGKEPQEISELKRNIELSLERHDINSELVQENIRRLAALRYMAISERHYAGLRLKADFSRSRQLYDCSRESWRESMVYLVNRTIERIHITASNQVKIELKNGQTPSEGA